MSEKREEYPVASLHTFLEEASKEFQRFRFQARVNLIGSIVLLLFLLRFLFFVFGNLGPAPFNPPPFNPGQPPPPMFVPDLFLLLAALAFVIWSLNVWLKQRRFVSRWGERFERLEALEKRFLPDETS
jgi:NADH:ubiquinone oxidoreductase subunit 5 (subunit L)/multisubunit Na+/H+ antiporter MnhA subunit